MLPDSVGAHRAVLYARVSTKEQESEGFSLEAQLGLLRSYATSKGLAVVREYVESETAKTAGRPVFAAMLKAIRDGEASADFINCVVFGKSAEFAERYFRQGLKVVVSGRIQTGSYTNRDGVKVYTTDVVVEDQEFAESKAVSDANAGSFRAAAPSPAPAPATPVSDAGDGFMNIPDGIDEELPFN